MSPGIRFPLKDLREKDALLTVQILIDAGNLIVSGLTAALGISAFVFA